MSVRAKAEVSFWFRWRELWASAFSGEDRQASVHRHVGPPPPAHPERGGLCLTSRRSGVALQNLLPGLWQDAGGSARISSLLRNPEGAAPGASAGG